MKYLFSISILLFSLCSFSQSYMNKIAKEACSCSEKLDDVTSESGQMQFGLCMMQASMPYKKQLLKDHGINLDNLGSDSNDASKLGEVVALEMISVCPETILQLASIADEETDEVIENSDLTQGEKVTGIIKSVKQDVFVSVIIKEDNGNTSTYYWLNKIECDSDIEANPNSSVGKEVVIFYKKSEFYDSKSKTYKTKRVITELKKI